MRGGAIFVIILAGVGLFAILSFVTGGSSRPVPPAQEPAQVQQQYVCPDGRVVSDPRDCPANNPPANPPTVRPQSPPTTAPAQQYEVAHGDILQDGTCHIRVSAPNQPVVVNSSGTYQVRRVFASSPSELNAQVESIRQGAAKHAGMSCPDG